MYDSHNIAATIKKQSKEKNIVIKSMLEELGLGSNTMSAMYHGKSIASDSLARIADYLGCSVDYLLGRDVPQPPTVAASVSGLPAHVQEVADAYAALPKEQKNMIRGALGLPPLPAAGAKAG